MSWPTFGTAVNIDPGWGTGTPACPDPTSGFGMDKIRGFRVVGREEIAPYLDTCVDAGKTILGVFTAQSKGYVYPRATILQLENEPDVQGIAPSAYADFYNVWRRKLRGQFPYFALAGLGTGLGNSRAYLEQLWPMLHIKPDFVAVHCYDGDVAQAAAEINDLWNAVQKPVITTEWNHANDQIWDMLAMLNGPEGLSSVWNSYYPYTQLMNGGLPGLLDADGNPTAEGASFVSAPYV